MIPDVFLAPICSSGRHGTAPALLFHLYVLAQLERAKRNALDHAVHDAPRPDPTIDYDPTPICAICRGSCCKYFPGFNYPSDFGHDERGILADLEVALRTGRYTLDYWQGDVYAGREYGSIPLIRPVVAGLEGNLYDEYDPVKPHGGVRRPCTFLTDTGCSLPRERIPRGCKLLEAKKTMGGECVDHGDGRRGAAIAWRPYARQVERLITKLWHER